MGEKMFIRYSSTINTVIFFMFFVSNPASAKLISGNLQAVQASYPYSWGDGTNDLTQDWGLRESDRSGWFFGTNSLGRSNADVYVYKGLGDPTTITDASKFDYCGSLSTPCTDSGGFGTAAIAAEGDTVFFRGLNGYYGAWQIQDIYYDSSNIYDMSALNGTWYFLDDGSSDFANQPPPKPEPPQYDSVLGHCSTNTEYLVLLTHGWNSNGITWPAPTSLDIIAKIKQAIINGELSGDLSQWCVVSYDWSKDAAQYTPLSAAAYAKMHGQKVAIAIDEMTNLKFIHFIAHSAGSNLINTATLLTEIFDSSIITHNTYLDAYHPDPNNLKAFGAHADWADYYFDTRPLDYFITWPIGEVLDTTDIPYLTTVNFDVTKLDPEGLELPSSFHAWPYKFYQNTISGTSSSCYGFNISYETGKFGPNPSDWLNIIKNNYPSLPCTSPPCPTYKLTSPSCYFVPETNFAGQTKLVTTSSQLINFDKIIYINSTTGVVTTGSTSLEITTGSPVWINIKIDTARKTNFIEFDYEFVSNAQGLFSVYYDGELAYLADEQFEISGAHSTGKLYLGDHLGGKHTLSFRLDTEATTASSITIDNIIIGEMKGNVFPWPMFLPAITHNGHRSL